MKKKKGPPELKFVEQGKSTLSLLGMNRIGTSEPWMIMLGSTSDKDMNDLIRWLNNHGGIVDERGASDTQFHTMTPSEIPSKIKPKEETTPEHEKLKTALKSDEVPPPEKEKPVPVYGGGFMPEEPVKQETEIPADIFLRPKDNQVVKDAQKESAATEARLQQEYEDSANFFVGDSPEDLAKQAKEVQRLVAEGHAREDGVTLDKVGSDPGEELKIEYLEESFEEDEIPKMSSMTVTRGELPENKPTLLEKIAEFCEKASEHVPKDAAKQLNKIWQSVSFAAPETGKLMLQELADFLIDEVGGENEEVNKIWNTIFSPEIAKLAEGDDDPEPAPPAEAEAQEVPDTSKILTKEQKKAMLDELANKTMEELQEMQIDVLGVLSDPRYVVFQAVYSGIEQQRPPCCIEFNARCQMLGLNAAKIGGAQDKDDPNYIRCPSCTLLMEEEIDPNKEMEFSPILLSSTTEPAQIDEKEKSMVSSGDDSQFGLFLEVKGIDYPLQLFPADPELVNNLRKQDEWYKATGDIEDIAKAIHRAKAWKTGVGRNMTGWYVLTSPPPTKEQKERGITANWFLYQEPEAL